MKKIEFGFIQGRMTNTPSKNILQYFPKKNWKKEFFYAKKYNFKFIEYFGERKLNKNNPIWNEKKLNEINYLVKKNKLYNYSFCDDYFINNNLISYKDFESYYLKLSKNLFKIKIKVYVLALFEKSIITKNNINAYAKHIKIIANIFDKLKIKVALETNIDAKLITHLLKLVSRKNVFIVYDTGNRLKKGNLQFNEIIKLNNYILHVHLKDKNWNDENVILGTGFVNFTSILMALKLIKFKGKFVFETNRGNNPRETMIRNKKYILNKLNRINIKK
jgi:sugar phosphate isomerase/epimerase